MTGRRPTPQQVALLEHVEAGRVNAHGGSFARGGAVSYHVWEGQDYPARTAAVERLIARGWVGEQGDYSPTRPWDVVLTDAGRQVLADARDRAEYEAIPYDQRPRVQVTRRDLGRSPVRGLPAPRPGRNVQCWLCYRGREHPDGYRSPTVWFINESGADAQARAEMEMIRHALAHVRAEATD